MVCGADDESHAGAGAAATGAGRAEERAFPVRGGASDPPGAQNQPSLTLAVWWTVVPCSQGRFLLGRLRWGWWSLSLLPWAAPVCHRRGKPVVRRAGIIVTRSEEHTSELQSPVHLV